MMLCLIEFKKVFRVSLKKVFAFAHAGLPIASTVYRRLFKKGRNSMEIKRWNLHSGFRSIKNYKFLFLLLFYKGFFSSIKVFTIKNHKKLNPLKSARL